MKKRLLEALKPLEFFPKVKTLIPVIEDPQIIIPNNDYLNVLNLAILLTDEVPAILKTDARLPLVTLAQECYKEANRKNPMLRGG